MGGFGVSDLPTSIPDAYLLTGGAGILGRLLFRARQIQSGRSSFAWIVLACDLPIALAMGWMAYGASVWAQLAMQPTVTAAIMASYLGPYTVERLLGRAADKYLGGKPQ